MTILNAKVHFKRVKMVNFMLCEHYLMILRQENKNKIILTSRATAPLELLNY